MHVQLHHVCFIFIKKQMVNSRIVMPKPGETPIHPEAATKGHQTPKHTVRRKLLQGKLALSTPLNARDVGRVVKAQTLELLTSQVLLFTDCNSLLTGR